MYIWENEDYVVIPVSYNIFYRESRRNKRHISFAREFSLSEDEELLKEIKGMVIEKKNEKIIAVDMERVNYPGKMFQQLDDLQEQVIFFNINNEVVRGKMQENLPKLKWNQEKNMCCLNGIISENTISAYTTIFVKASQKLYSEILYKITDTCKKDTPIVLDSSGLYSNMYISVKKLFLHPYDYYYVLYGMAGQVEKLGEFDSFISSSKNGAIIATLLGTMLNKKAVHLQGVGPKYSMRFGNKQNEIKRGRTYIYVYDFICTGTESKIVSALITANDAYMVGEIGFARYYSSDRERINSVKNQKCLITTEEAKLDYKIAGSKSDILKLL